MKKEEANTSSHTLFFDVTGEHEGLSLKEILYDHMKLSSRLVRKLKRNKGIFVNGNRIPFHAKMRKGDRVQVIMEEEANQFEAEDIPIQVIYEDMDLLIINKEPGIVVHPTKGHPNGTMANAIVHYMQKKGEIFKIRFVNRLDRDTSGLIIVAKNSHTQQVLSKQMQKNQIQKQYIAIVEGMIAEDRGTIDEPIGRPDPEDIRRKVCPEGQPSVTHYEVLSRFGKKATLIRVFLETGRTHQIRVHMEHIGHPLLGDALYGSKEKMLIGRQALHAEFLSFTHPRTEERIAVRAPMPFDMQEAIKKLSVFAEKI